MVHVGKYLKEVTLAASLCLVSLSVPFYSATAAEATEAAPSALDGKAIAFDRKKGNCLSCHMIAGGDMAGNIAPPLIAMKARFPDKAVLRAQIADATVKNPASFMPPFGRHQILSEKEIDAVVDFIHAL
ncbi:MAG TPA: sulfur oxidation c-type cytochrome SoxX [Thiothrix sp.]|nr:sulfur oxidation c-type cytochrome SoxX [Thiothrix sp.]